MTLSAPLYVSAAVEGIVDEAVVRKLITLAGGHAGAVYGKGGKPTLRQKIDGYNNAARRAPWVVLVDLDHDADCAPPLRADWVPAPAKGLCFRVAVREVEAWLLADSATFSRFIGVSQAMVPRAPEDLDDPKRAVVDLARKSRRRSINSDMVPRPRSGRAVGPAYGSRLVEYVHQRWRPEVAAEVAPSLRRALDCLGRLTKRQG